MNRRLSDRAALLPLTALRRLSLCATGIGDAALDYLTYQRYAMASSDGRTAAIRQAPPQQLVAAKNNDAQLLEEILSQPGADANAANGIGQNALHVAALWGSTAALTVLLDHGADLAARNSFGITALHYAAQNARKEAVLLLLERGADPNLRAGNGLLPFEICKDDEIRALLGAPSNALHAAVAAGDAAAVTTLIAAGEDPAEVDRDGKTAVHLAVDAALASNDTTLLAAVLASPRANATSARCAPPAAGRRAAPRRGRSLERAAARPPPPAPPPDLQTVKRGEHLGAWVRRDGDGATAGLDSADLCALHLVLDGRDGDDEASVLECIATVLAHNASVDVRDVLYRTPLHLALALAFEEGDGAGGGAPRRQGRPESGNKEWGMASSCLHEAARRGNATAVKPLGAGAAVDARPRRLDAARARRPRRRRVRPRAAPRRRRRPRRFAPGRQVGGGGGAAQQEGESGGGARRGAGTRHRGGARHLI